MSHCAACGKMTMHCCCPRARAGAMGATGVAGGPGATGASGAAGLAGGISAISLAEDRSTSSGTFADLLAISVITTLPFVELLATYALHVVADDGSGVAELELWVDGAAVPFAGAISDLVDVGSTPNVQTNEIGSIGRTIALAPGPHTFALRWRIVGNNITASVPVTSAPDAAFHAYLRVLEIASATILTSP